MATLTSIDATRNRHRFYMLRVSRTLFDEWSLLREWGRIGSPGRVRHETFETEQQARDAERIIMRMRQRHGYELAE
jgi:predicted DNA-binding WGR domain protein